MGGNDMSIKFEDRKNLVSLVEGAISCEYFEDGTCKFLDKDENILPSPSSAVIQARKDEIQAEIDSVAYARNRQAEYPDWGTQLNKIYDDGIDAWKTDMVDPIKAKFPKP